MAKSTVFDDFARRWLLSGNLQAEYADCIVEMILKGPIQRVPPRLRKIARALRLLRSGELIRPRGRVRSRNKVKASRKTR